jgi:endonuclease YncB( thermonuclease family)
MQARVHDAGAPGRLERVIRRLCILVLLAAVAVLGGRATLGSDVDVPAPRDGQVVRVVDGDTLHVRVGGEDETVRIVGIDTPEVGDCGAAEATDALEDLARGRVVLRRDPTQDRRDRYGRLLAYVSAGGADVGERLVRDGWAELFVFEDDPFERVDRYRRAFDRARSAGRGVHGLCPGAF